MHDNPGQIVVFFRPFCKVMMLFSLAHLSGPHHNDVMVGNLFHVIAAQTYGHYYAALHSEARMKITMNVKLARPTLVEHISAVVTTPKMVGAHKNKCAVSQAETNSINHDPTMPEKPHALDEIPRPTATAPIPNRPLLRARRPTTAPNRNPAPTPTVRR